MSQKTEQEKTDEENTSFDGIITQHRNRLQGRKIPMKPNESPKVSEEIKLYFFGNDNDRYAQDIILSMLKKTKDHVDKNPDLSDLFYRISPIPDRNSGIEDFQRSFNKLVNTGLLQYLFDELDVTFFGVFLMLDKKGKPSMIFGKKGFRPEFMESMTYVAGYHLIYQFDMTDDTLVYLMIDEWELKERKKEVNAEPVVPPSMETDFPPLPAQVSDPVVETSVPVEESEQVDEPPVQKIDVVKSSRDSVLDDVRLSSLLSFAKGDMTEEALFNIFMKLPPV